MRGINLSKESLLKCGKTLVNCIDAVFIPSSILRLADRESRFENFLFGTKSKYESYLYAALVEAVRLATYGAIAAESFKY